jgi:hypothetical protein
MAGPGETSGSSWPPHAVRPCFCLKGVTDLVDVRRGRRLGVRAFRFGAAAGAAFHHAGTAPIVVARVTDAAVPRR